MFKFIIWTIVFYCLIRFVFNFLIPVIRAGRQMKSQMKDFQDRMNSRQYPGNVNGQGFQDAGSRQQPKRQSSTAKSGDYIDFEEIK